MGFRKLACALDSNSGPILSLQASSFFTSIYTDPNGFPHYHGPGVFLRLKKDLRGSYRNANYILLVSLHQMNSLEGYGVAQTLTHLVPTLEKTRNKYVRGQFHGSRVLTQWVKYLIGG